MDPVPHDRVTRALVAGAATLSLLLALAAGIAARTLSRAADQGTRCFDGGAPPCVPDERQEVGGPCVEDACNYLVLGSDSRRGLTPEELARFGSDRDIGGANRADTIMVVHTDPTREKAVVLSFPRDLWVEVPGRGYAKINSAFEGGIGDGGPLLMARTIHRLTGLRINHFLYVDLAGFQDIVDTLGGVELNIPTRLDDPLTDLHLRAGVQILSGRDALAFVRTRHLPCDSANPDLARIGRQQQFLRALVNRMLQPAQLARAPSLVGPILGNLRRDPDLQIPTLAFLVGQLRGLDTGAVEFRAVPGTSRLIHPPGYPGGLAVVKMLPLAERLFEAIREGGAKLPTAGAELEGVPPSPANILVPVVNVDAASNADEVLALLSASGFDISGGVVTPGKLQVPTQRPAIAFGSDDLERARVVQQYLPQLEMIEVGRLSGVAVVVTEDYRPPVEGPAPTECVA
jgi:LCP family protein required for cell wall assembly